MIDLTVVVGSVASERSIRACLASVLTSCAGLRSEIIVVDASTDETASLVRRYFPEVQLTCLPPGTLIPVLWSTGLASARGSRVAFTTGHCVVPQVWAIDLNKALDTGAAGAGGPIALGPGASLVHRAIYFLRYSAFMPSDGRAVVDVSEIAGDNAMYERSVFDEHRSSLADGLWEVEIHHALRAQGRRLVMAQSAGADLAGTFPLALITRYRFAHGRHYGAWRVRQKLVSASRIVVAAPAVPVLLLARTARRVIRSGSKLIGFFSATPIMFWLASSWAFGEAVGALRPSAGARQAPDLEAARAHRN
ncbi:MAG TPA: glycosyltransferase family 2 protein [Gemmatimonadaceae bacterium]|nr:glycosyltransferase family 2 protein [Gemmatimonadaceae bacterium]